MGGQGWQLVQKAVFYSLQKILKEAKRTEECKNTSHSHI